MGSSDMQQLQFMCYVTSRSTNTLSPNKCVSAMLDATTFLLKEEVSAPVCV